MVVDHAHRTSCRSSARILRARASAQPRLARAPRRWPLPLDQTGILASVTGPLAPRIFVFALATYDTITS